MKILVSGGTGYIGSHTCVELLNKGYDVVAFDNLYNSKIDVVDRVEKITGKKLIFYKADMLDKESMRPIFEEHKFDAVIHFAALKAVGESVQKPLAYYKNNISGSLNLCELMNEYGCKISVYRIRNGVLYCFVTLIQSVPMRAVSLVRARTVFRTT